MVVEQEALLPFKTDALIVIVVTLLTSDKDLRIRLITIYGWLFWLKRSFDDVVYPA